MIKKLGFSGACHWCTEAIFQSVAGVIKTKQGWISSEEMPNQFSEGVLMEYDDKLITLDKLLEIHLMTHSSRSNHSMRHKYKSAAYVFNATDFDKLKSILKRLNSSSEQYITQMLYFKSFKLNEEKYLDYYKRNQNAPFCQRYIAPKLEQVNQIMKSKNDFKVAHRNN